MRALVERSHRDGELLRARDLTADVTGEEDRRALHVRAVHGTWGVALGFELEPVGGARAVAVGPGFGYDCRGREIASAERTLAPAPTLDRPADLVISADCGIRLAWREPGHACADELVLARGQFKDGRVLELDKSVRHSCRSRRFRLAGGVVEKRVAAKVTISTAPGSFRSTPYYFATLESNIDAAATLEIDNETASSFRLSFRAPAEQIKQADKKKLKVRVHWVGVEPVPRCEFGPEENR
jgi:hypothetical protein